MNQLKCLQVLFLAAAQHLRRWQAEHGDQRQQRVARDMSKHDATARQAARAGGKDKVLAPGFGTYLRQAGRPAQAYRVPVEEITGAWGVPSPLGAIWKSDLSRAFQSRKYDYVLTEHEVFVPGGALEGSGYVQVGPLFPPNDEFWLWTSGWTLAADVYVPQERAAELAAAAGLSPPH